MTFSTLGALRAATIGVLAGALVATAMLTPSWSAERSAEQGAAPVVGGFGIGDALEASIDERDGALAFDVPAGGLQLRWDSRAPADDRYGFGPRWSLGLASIDVRGGVRVSPSSGRPFEVDPSQPSGLRGYDTDDVVFMQEAGKIATPRSGEVEFAFVLHELGGVVTYFNAAGDPVARRDAGDAWTVWEWAAGVAHRLDRTIGPEGIVTELDWTDPRVVRVRPGANVTAADPASGVGGEWVIEVDDGSIAAVTDPLGARTGIAYRHDGLVSVIGGDSGARTAITWTAGIDAVSRVGRLQTYDQSTGELLSERTWEVAGAPTGWPAAVDEVLSAGYSTVLSDGATRVESEYNALHQLVRRALRVSGPGGAQVLQEQRLQYPGTDEHGAPTTPPDALPRSWTRPSSTESISFDAVGAQRSLREHSTFDEYGRLIHDVHGVEYRYDAENRLHAEITPDGEVTRTSYWPDGSRRTRLDERFGRTETYYWDGEQLINDVHVDPGDDANTGTAAYLLGGIRHARISNSTEASASARIEYFTTDRHGSVTELTDGAGALTARYDYADYGGVTAQTPPEGAGADGLARNPFQFAGEYTDESGNQYLRARMYHPELMRFSTMDVLPFHNKAAYADANPIMHVDPTGHAAQKDWLYVGLAALGIVLSFVGLVTSAGTSAAALGFAIFATVVDVGFTTMEVVNRVEHHFMSDEVAEALGWTAFGVGLAAAALGTAAEIAHRSAKVASRPQPLLDGVGNSDRARIKHAAFTDPTKKLAEAEVVGSSIKTFLAGSGPRDAYSIIHESYQRVVGVAGKLLEGKTLDPAPVISKKGLWAELWDLFGLPEDIGAIIAKFAGIGQPTPAAVHVARTVHTYVPNLIKVAEASTNMSKKWNYGQYYAPIIANNKKLVENSRRVLRRDGTYVNADGEVETPPPAVDSDVDQYE
ncbi:RHS repeat domain-containing protein [Agromyces aerolatus]|uniref:RHS repeat domain-containing protein n=1 Tax=Agromyces sp. LY-1074 TaxID=3074080 RepID=UPI002857E399|nr:MULTISPECIES: RHS repeat-associated core domain-containing protein [unclassified Agromyces]MDR5698214.1 RHS repeat-associated core domain-containing protein [Agromyces sp. LY-1074]MDR5704508.1 RHS repeat-associated core domain-containing protein [Agromyces sp. LY-1358]